MKISREVWEVLSEIIAGFATVVFVSIGVFAIESDYPRLTISIILFILITWIAIIFRRNSYDKP